MSEKNKRAAYTRKDELKAGTQLSLDLPTKEEEKTTMPTDTGIDFETNLQELEKVVQQLEGEVKLEEALSLFDKGMQLSQHCEEFLKSAEQKIEILKRAANGSLSAEKFNEESLQSQV